MKSVVKRIRFMSKKVKKLLKALVKMPEKP